MALRGRVRFEGREAFGVAALSVLMWVGISWIFGLPAVMVWIVGVLLFLGVVLKGGGATSPDEPGGHPTPKSDGPPDKTSLYGPEE